MNREHKYDFFISHASEDKKAFVKPLADKLVNSGYSVWYDDFSLAEKTESLTQEISNGIRYSQYGIIVLSKYFFHKKWAMEELNALFSKKMRKGSDYILIFIWLEIDENYVGEHAPLLCDKIAILAKHSDIESVIEKIEQKTGITITKKEQIQEIIEDLKTCNEDRRNKYLFDLKKRLESIFLYQQEYYNWYTSISEKEWDDILVDLKGREFRNEYGIPNGVWLNDEPFPKQEIERTIKLCSK